MKKGSWLLLGLVAVVAIALSSVTSFAALSTRTAQSHKVHIFHSRGNAQPSSKAASTSTGANVTYHGGPVMFGTTNVYAIFWEPPSSSVSANYNSLIKRYFGDVGGSPLYKINSQYPQTGGAFPSNAKLAGSWVDTSAYPETPLLDSDIQNEVSNAQSANGWSSSIDNIFFVFTEQNTDLCFDSSQTQCASNTFCAYHNYFGSNTIYAAMPYAASFSCQTPGSPNNDDADLTINVTSHEQMEAATDPLLNAWSDSSGQENGDKCAWNFGNVNPDGSNVNWNGDPYIVQQEWDNVISGCALTGP